MITRLKGELAECDLTEIVVDVHGVGFAVSVPMSTFDKLPRVGNEISLYTYLHVRDDGMQLFGFAAVEERQLFRLLISVSGVGPRLALNILSCLSVRNFCETVASGDIKALSRVNGIGKRSAERLVVELRERVQEISPAAGLDARGRGDAATREAQDAVSALETLGFKSDLARKTVQKLCSESAAAGLTAEQLIRKALQALNS